MMAVAGATSVISTCALSSDSSSEVLNDRVPEPPCSVSGVPLRLLVPPTTVVTGAALATPTTARAAAAARVFSVYCMSSPLSLTADLFEVSCLSCEGVRLLLHGNPILGVGLRAC